MSRNVRLKPNAAGPRHTQLKPPATRPWHIRLRPNATVVSVAVVLLAGLVAYSNSFNGVFVLDEQSAIVDNPNIRSIATSLSAPKDVGFAGRPVVSLSFALNYALAPSDAREAFAVPTGAGPEAVEARYRNLWGYHAVNLAIHLLAALTLFGILRRTLSDPRLADRFDGAASGVALAAAALWVAHPLCTGSITYVAQRVESLMGLFFLLTVYCAIRAADGRRSRGWTAASVLFCALGCGTKEVMVAAPLIVLLYDWIFLASSRPSAPVPGFWRTRWPLYAGYAACWGLLAALVVANPRSASIGLGLHGWSPWLYLQTQAGVIVHYLRLCVVPWPLVLDYEWTATPLAAVWPQAVVLLALVALTAWGVVRRAPAALAGAWFFLILAPSSSVLPIVTEVAAEHRMYLPLAGVLALVVAAVFRVTDRVPRGRTPALVLLAATGVTACAYLTRQRNDDYSSYERTWAGTVASRPANARARSNLGTALFEQGRASEAEAQLREAVRLRADYPEAQANLGAVLCSEGRVEEGLPHLQRAIALAPDYRDAYRNLGEALATLGRNAEALAAFRSAMTTAPDDPRLLSRVAWLLATSPEESVRDGRHAVSLAERAVQITDGRDADSLDTLAAAYAEVDRFSDAAATEQRALAAAQGSAGALTQEMQARLDLYRAGRKFRQSPPQHG
jgi:protein O-mannosyl-transferase